MQFVRRCKGPLGLIDRIHALQSILAKAYGRPTDAMRTDLVRDGQTVIFLHNPKTAGKSLRKFLNVRRHSHSFASDRLSERNWLATYSIVAVRHPFERFLSGYYDHVMKSQDNGLVGLFGPEVKTASPFDYLDLLKAAPKFGGPQVQWSDYPSSRKPRADLVLRFEEICQWKAHLVQAGLDVGARDVPHLNRSARCESNHLHALKVSPPEFARLQDAVRDHFAQDYTAFGYC